MGPHLASALTPAFRLLDAERAHRLAITALRLGLAGRDTEAADPALRVDVMGLHFPNPIGLAAGFDKDARAIRGLRRLGFGSVEAGTVTPLPQPGNPAPRVFRLAEDRAVINRYGFNSGGVAGFVARLASIPRRGAPVGANVGINKEGADPVRDFPAMVAAVAPHADYVVINVSSPNTPGLRDQQTETHLRDILAAVRERVPHHPPLLVKLAPDLAEDAIGPIVEAVVAGGARGLIISNTTTARPRTLRSPFAHEAGGLSGPMLMEPSTRLLAQAYRLAAGRLVLIGAGGITTGADVLAKLRAGAHLVQLYTAFAYDGPALIPRLRRELRAALRLQGFHTVKDAIGTAA